MASEQEKSNKEESSKEKGSSKIQETKSTANVVVANKMVMDDFNKQPFLDYHAQPHQEIQQLDSDEDQTAVIPIEHIVRPVKEVYGQQPYDMQGLVIDWAQWGVVLNNKHRPSPYQFPAFERQLQDMRKYERNDSIEALGGSRKTKTAAAGTQQTQGGSPSAVQLPASLRSLALGSSPKMMDKTTSDFNIPSSLASIGEGMGLGSQMTEAATSATTTKKTQAAATAEKTQAATAEKAATAKSQKEKKKSGSGEKSTESESRRRRNLSDEHEDLPISI